MEKVIWLIYLLLNLVLFCIQLYLVITFNKPKKNTNKKMTQLTEEIVDRLKDIANIQEFIQQVLECRFNIVDLELESLKNTINKRNDSKQDGYPGDDKRNNIKS